jgi:hypothetical protein
MVIKTRTSLKPDLEITISDAAGEADFSTLTAGQVDVVVELRGEVIVDDPCDAIVPAPDGKSAVVKRAWQAGDMDEGGRLWARVRVRWGGSVPQYFPAAGPLRLDVVRAPGDA